MGRGKEELSKFLTRHVTSMGGARCAVVKDAMDPYIGGRLGKK